jgi:hypothetical protein
MVVGWSLQKDGYQRIVSLNSKLLTPFAMSADEKAGRVKALRDNHKELFKFLYTRKSEELDYLVNKSKTPSYPMSDTEVASLEEYRKSIELGSFNLAETKKYFYDSYKNDINNVDLSCGGSVTKPPYDFSRDVNAATTTGDQSSIENYIGKVMYWTTFPELNGVYAKRCEVEDLINKL